MLTPEPILRLIDAKFQRRHDNGDHSDKGNCAKRAKKQALILHHVAQARVGDWLIHDIIAIDFNCRYIYALRVFMLYGR